MDNLLDWAFIILTPLVAAWFAGMLHNISTKAEENMANEEFLNLVNVSFPKAEVFVPPSGSYYTLDGTKYMGDIDKLQPLEIWECGHCGASNWTGIDLSCIACGAPYSRRKK